MSARYLYGSHKVNTVSSFLGKAGSIVVDSATGLIYIHDGVTVGGVRAPSNVLTSNIQTANYTLILSDGVQTALDMNSASAVNVTVPLNASVPFPIGTVIEICQYGAGQITFVPTGGVTIRTASSLTTRTQYSTVALRKRATDEWVLSGDLT